jgi:23S rRNA (uracil1939-C5)-methyltransferase
VVLLDPPRAGCKEVVPHLAALGAERLVYISCDPATLIRDLGLIGEQGYAIERMQLVDMFPQTHHLETMVLLRRAA